MTVLAGDGDVVAVAAVVDDIVVAVAAVVDIADIVVGFEAPPQRDEG